VVTFPDKPQGRKLILTPNPIKGWAQNNKVQIIESDNFKSEEIVNKLKEINADVFIVASFGKILPDSIINLPKFKTLNVHPSLLPKLRGPSPIQEAILRETETGISIMRLTSKMDEGPVLKQARVLFSNWPVGYIEAERTLGEEGGQLLADVLPKWINDAIEEREQNHVEATYTKLINKSDSDISNDSALMAYHKILAYEVWPRARLGDLIIKSAHIENGLLVIDKVIPPGKSEMFYKDYLKTKTS